MTPPLFPNARMPSQPSAALSPRLLLLLLLLLRANADCKIRLPVAGESAPPPVPSPTPVAIVPATARILSGIRARDSDHDNIVTISFTENNIRQYRCAGTVIAPEWVLTSAQCRVRPSEHTVLYGGRDSLVGFQHEIANFYTPGDFGAPTDVIRDDIQLIRLASPIFQAVLSPSPDPSPTSSPTGPPDSTVTTVVSPPPVLPNPNFNFMRVNTNTNFAIQGTASRYLRVKGYGLTVQPQDSEDAITGVSRPLTFADVRTAKCDDGFGSDRGRRICTKSDNDCGPCFGDTGSPLYDVDASGRGAVQVGIVTFGATGIAPNDPVCSDGRSPIIYTAVAPYTEWIQSVIQGNFSTFFIPDTGITNTTIVPEESNLSKFARMSVIVISSLALIGLITALVVTCTLRALRRRRRRWIDGLHAEESFVKGGMNQDSIIIDPFEGMMEDRKSKRGSIAGLSRAAIKGAGEFSSRSIGAVRAFLKQVEEQEMEEMFEEREPIDDAPQWLPGAWDKLFKPPSRKEQLKQIHTVPTQRVVDDVLEGGDKDVEPTLESVAYKNARDEANLEAAWKKLEMQTSLRNISEASGSVDEVKSPGTPSSFSSNMSTPRLISRQGSRKASRSNSGHAPFAMRSVSPPMSKELAADHSKADTLLAAFASIDAESEQVAEETIIDSSALHTLAIGKRSTVLSALRKKFSSGSSNENLERSNSDRTSEADIAHSPSLHANNSGRSATASPARNVSNPGVMLGNSIMNRMASARTASNNVPQPNLSANSSGGFGSAMSRNSMLMDYFSEEYDLSDSSSDEEVRFEIYSHSRRFTDDRLGDGLSSQDSMLRSNSGKISRIRKTPARSFETLTKLDRGSSKKDEEFEDADSDSEINVESEQLVMEDTPQSTVAAVFSANVADNNDLTLPNIAPLGASSLSTAEQLSRWSPQVSRMQAFHDSSSSAVMPEETVNTRSQDIFKPSHVYSDLDEVSPQAVEPTLPVLPVRPVARVDFAEGIVGEGLEIGDAAGGMQEDVVAEGLQGNAGTEGLEKGVVAEGLEGESEDRARAVSVKMLKDMWNEKISDHESRQGR